MTAANGWLIAAPRSGGGKTTVTLGLVAALRRRGVAVRTAKSGPDYIDPAFHAAASGHPGLNLDSWAMPPDLVAHLAADLAADLTAGVAEPSSLIVVESAMGLFDGVAGPPGRTGAAADLAASLGLPVLLVLDVSGQSQTAAAVALGLHRYRPGVELGGVILNKVGSARHRAGVEAALAGIGLPVLGAIPRDATLALPERHLGLVQAQEHPDLEARLAALAAMAERCLDLDAILAQARPLMLSPGNASPGVHAGTGRPAPALAPPGQRIALATDAAFSFIYPHLLAGWRAAGAEILPFSPLADQPPPAAADCCWLPGGYPELHAAALSHAARFRAGLCRFAETRPIHGECGGYMALGTGLVDADGSRHAMAGLLTHVTSFARRAMTLGYRQATTRAASALGPAGTRLRGHEFHYATLAEPGQDAPLADLTDGQGQPIGPAGGCRGRVTGSFYHAIAREA